MVLRNCSMNVHPHNDPPHRKGSSTA
jgi:hypothetical protein